MFIVPLSAADLKPLVFLGLRIDEAFRMLYFSDQENPCGDKAVGERHKELTREMRLLPSWLRLYKSDPLQLGV